MNHEEQISRMQSERLIDDRQAELLRSTIQGDASGPQDKPSRFSRWLLTILITLILALVAALVFSSGSDPETLQNISQTLNQPGSTGNMNRNLSVSLSIILILIIPLLVITWLYNSIVAKEEKTMESWAQVEAAYQRRADLIPALVETVSRYVKHEQKTLEQVTGARTESAIGSETDVDRLLMAQKRAIELLQSQTGQVPTDESLLADLAKAQTMVGKSAHQLIAVAEAYPQLRASDQFLELQAQFEGSENRILTARSRFNEAVEEFNGAIRKLPGSLIASLGRFQRKAYFRADAGSAQSPQRNWN